MVRPLPLPPLPLPPSPLLPRLEVEALELERETGVDLDDNDLEEDAVDDAEACDDTDAINCRRRALDVVESFRTPIVPAPRSFCCLDFVFDFDFESEPPLRGLGARGLGRFWLIFCFASLPPCALGGGGGGGGGGSGQAIEVQGTSCMRPYGLWFRPKLSRVHGLFRHQIWDTSQFGMRPGYLATNMQGFL